MGPLHRGRIPPDSGILFFGRRSPGAGFQILRPYSRSDGMGRHRVGLCAAISTIVVNRSIPLVFLRRLALCRAHGLRACSCFFGGRPVSWAWVANDLNGVFNPTEFRYSLGPHGRARDAERIRGAGRIQFDWTRFSSGAPLDVSLLQRLPRDTMMRTFSWQLERSCSRLERPLRQRWSMVHLTGQPVPVSSPQGGARVGRLDPRTDSGGRAFACDGIWPRAYAAGAFLVSNKHQPVPRMDAER